jgi:hypothetical protein
LSGGNAQKENEKQLGEKHITQTYNPVDGEWSKSKKTITFYIPPDTKTSHRNHGTMQADKEENHRILGIQR